MRENECLPDPKACGCLGHVMPGVSHMVPCCDKPHITAEQFQRYAEGKEVVDSEKALLHRMNQIVGYAPIGTKDLLHVLAHPDLLSLTLAYFKEKDEALHQD